MKPRTSIIWKTPKEDFIEIINESNTIKEVIVSLGLDLCTSHYKTINARIKEDNIDTSHFNPYLNRKSVEKISLDEILIENSTYSRVSLKRRLIDDGLLEECCSICKIGNEWNGRFLSLQLDHINGVNDDNRIENLRLLCPNCHSQTDTFGSRNAKRKKRVNNCLDCNKEISTQKNTSRCIECQSILNRKVERPSKDELSILIKNQTMKSIGDKYGVADNTVRKWCRAYDLPFKKKDIDKIKEL